MHLYAVKFQSQNPAKPISVGGNVIWQKFSIVESQIEAYEQMNYTILSNAEMVQTTINGNKQATQFSFLDKSIREKREFALDLIEGLKRENILAGINALQGIWLHHKLRALPVTFANVPMVVDLLNMVISGDVEVACVALMNCEVDDMSKPYHWFSDAQRDKIVERLKAYLGWQ